MYLQKVLSQKLYKKTNFFVGILSVTGKKARSGSESESGSVSQWYESADPDPDLYQNVTDSNTAANSSCCHSKSRKESRVSPLVNPCRLYD
jgi:hypothetical protein